MLEQYTKFPLPPNLPPTSPRRWSRYGRVSLERHERQPVEARLRRQAAPGRAGAAEGVRSYLGERLDDVSFAIEPAFRGVLKQALIAVGYPAEDLAGYTEGAALPIELRDGRPQRAAVPRPRLPARGGRRLLRRRRRPRRLRRDRPALRRGQDDRRHRRHGAAPEEHAGPDHQHHRRQAVEARDPRQDRPRPTTQVAELHRRLQGDRPGDAGDLPDRHLPARRRTRTSRTSSLFNQRDWGLIIYDEVHLLPAPVFRVTAEIQARRRLGLTATLVREDGREEDVFSLIGPKKYDVPWRELERRAGSPRPSAHEVRVGLPDDRCGWNTPWPSGATSTARQREPGQGRPGRGAARPATTTETAC